MKRLLIALASCALAATGCASAAAPHTAAAPTSVGAPPPGFPPAVSFARLAAARSLDSGVQLDVPAANAVPKVSPAAAYATCLNDGVCDRSSGPTIELAVVSDPNTGTRASNGSITPTLNHTLAYVLTWHNVICAPAGGPPGTSPTPTTCTLYNFVDANTGKVLLGFQASGPYVLPSAPSGGVG